MARDGIHIITETDVQFTSSRRLLPRPEPPSGPPVTSCPAFLGGVGPGAKPVGGSGAAPATVMVSRVLRRPAGVQRAGVEGAEEASYLEEQGIPHRDIKPDNIAVVMVGRGDRLHLVLFDFSLSRMPADNIRAGTNGYLDPLLPLRKPPRWDHWHLGTQNFVKISTLTPEEEQATSRSLEETLAKDTEDICAVPRPAR